MKIFSVLPLRHLYSLVLLIILQTVVLVIEIKGIYYAVPQLIQVFSMLEVSTDPFEYIIPVAVLLLAAMMRFISTLNIIFYIENERRLLTTFYLRSMMNTSLDSIRTEGDYEHAKKTISEADQVVNYYLKNLAEFTTGIISVLICSYIFYSVGGWAFIFTLSAIVFGIIIFNMMLKPKLRQASKNMIVANSKRFKVILDAYANYKFFRANSLVESQFKELNECTTIFRNSNVVSQVLSQAFINVIEIASLLLVCVLLIIYQNDLYDLLVYINLDDGFLHSGAGVLILLIRLRPAFNKIYSGFNRMSFGYEVNQNFVASLISVHYPTTPFQGYVSEIKKLKIIYKKKKMDGMENALVCNIRVNDICIIHGASGAGKTTLLDMMTGLYKEPTNLEIEINGELVVQSLVAVDRRNFHYCTELAYIADAGLIENIDLEGNCDIDRLEKVIELLNLEHLRKSMFLDSSVLSAGEKSRINIARALVSDKDILIFDESFSSIGLEATTNILEYISKELRCICFIVSHDQNLIQDVRYRKWLIT